MRPSTELMLLIIFIFQSGKRSAASLPKDPNVVSNQQEEDDIAKAIQLSLQENKSSSSQQVHKLKAYKEEMGVFFIHLIRFKNEN